ncbi:hypothetical protein Lbir_0474 [Legionella birminghamensis]|uniref:Predicted outer membrane protein n=1 Tax=Legionella birminghamensis TaxID=28083 RepID=A0A378ICZ7_9GAMM|nr:DUF4142 domain-containing protein [Legionella birminghamensis]KTC75329.1 hypothetical protein Lbir_0474 [Legionella birminghamensis]STX33097.1 Predicted outer membrane protein [Legionella birminghamensis]
MHNFIKFSLLSSAILFASACGMNSPDYLDTPSTPMTAAQKAIDGRIIGGLIALNQNEIAAGQLAEAKAVSPSVKNFGQMMVREHGANLSTTEMVAQRTGITPINGPVAATLKYKGKMELAKLKRLNGPAFDKAYIAAMVKGHAEALKLIDTKLMQQAVNPMLRAHLEKTRAHVSQHLQEAQAIQQSIM